MPRLRYSKRSRADLDDIWAFIASDSSRNATAVIGHRYAKIEQLRTQPLIGHRHEDLHPDIRCLNSDGDLVPYRYSARIVRADRIIHHSRDLPVIPFNAP